MAMLIDSCNVLIAVTSVVAVIVLIIGVVKATVKFIRNELSRSDNGVTLRAIKNELGAYILLSLEILIAADIIESIIKPTLADIAKLAALVVIRTVISYFLGRSCVSKLSARITRRIAKTHGHYTALKRSPQVCGSLLSA